MIMPEEYSFKGVAETCGVCHGNFEKDAELLSALKREEDVYVRLDFCLPCWEKEGSDGFLCFWKRKPRLKETQPTVDGAVVFEIFQRLETAEDRHDRNFRYILGLLLMRRKRLKFLDVERTEDGEFLIMEDRALEGVKYRLLDPGLTEEEMERTRNEVGKLFSVNVDGEESAGPPPAAPSSSEESPAGEGAAEETEKPEAPEEPKASGEDPEIDNPKSEEQTSG